MVHVLIIDNKSNKSRFQNVRAENFRRMLREEGIESEVLYKTSVSALIKSILNLRPKVICLLNGDPISDTIVLVISKLFDIKAIYDLRTLTPGQRNPLLRKAYLFLYKLNVHLSDKTFSPILKLSKLWDIELMPQAVKEQKKTFTKNFIIYCGSFRKMEGPDILIKAFKMIKNKKVQLILIGKGPLQRKLFDLAKSDKRIKILGYRDHEECLKWIREALLCVVPMRRTYASDFDSIYSVLKLADYLSANKPIVCADVGDLNKAKGYGVLLFEPGNIIDLCRKIEKQLKNPIRTRVPKEILYEEVKKKFLRVIHEFL